MSDYPVHVEIEKKVHLIRGANRARFPEANALLIDDEILTLIDAGASRNHIVTTLRDLGHKPEDIDRIVLSHFHIDHKGHAAHFQEVSGCTVMCHPSADHGIKTLDGLIDFYGIKNHRYFDQWRYFIEARLPHVISDYRVDEHFEDGKPIDCGEIELIPIHAPGHSVDHTCFGINGYDTILLVDIDLTRFGPWYGNQVSDITQFKETMMRIIKLEPKTGISSHLLDPVTENLHDRLVDFEAAFDQRDERILKLISQGHDTIEKLSQVPAIYPRIPHEVYLTFEEIMIEKHVDLLSEKGLILVEDGRLQLQKA